MINKDRTEKPSGEGKRRGGITIMRKSMGKAFVGDSVMEYFVTGDNRLGYSAEIQQSVTYRAVEQLLPGGDENFQRACRFVQNLREGTVYADALWQVAEDYRSDAAIGEDRFSGRG